MNPSSRCSTSLSAFGGVGVSDLDHSNCCVVVSHCLKFQFPNDIWCSFAVCYLWWVVCSGLLLFLKLNCSFIYGGVFRVSLDILDNNPLSDMSSVKIFSQSVICLLILLRLYPFHQIKMQRGKFDPQFKISIKAIQFLQEKYKCSCF